MARKRSEPLTSVTDALSWLKIQAPYELWFRGQARNWKPEPSLLRKDIIRALRVSEGRRSTRLWGPNYATDKYKESDPTWLVPAERRLNYEFIRETRSFLNTPAS